MAESGRVAADSEPLTTVVTATRTPRPHLDLPPAVVVLPRAELERSPTLTLDALVRTVPSAATFRRSTSLVADPTAQGLNLRGVGPSGVSRALVLRDGVPVSEPFGNWIYWRSLPRLGVDRIEVVPGPGSGLYGSSAMGGVLQAVSRPLTPATFDADLLGGTQGTAELAARGTHAGSWWGAGLEGEYLRTDGHRIVDSATAGSVDTLAHGDHGVVSARGEVQPSDDVRVAGRIGYFAQSQNGGTRFTTSRVRLLDASLQANQKLPLAGEADIAVFHRAELFEQQRARISTDRMAEAPSAQQRVPASDFGLAAVFTSRPIPVLGQHVLSVGADVRWGSGSSEELLFPPSVTAGAVLARLSTGEQRLAGLFVQEEWKGGPLVVQGTLRFDVWQSSNGRREEAFGDGSVVERQLPENSDRQWSPKLGVLFRPLPWLAFRASGGSAFRAPTLNELYRPFQVGTVLTAANEGLRAERLWGGDVGVELNPSSSTLLRVTGFGHRLTDPITNVTLAAPTSDGAQRRRDNLGASQILGVEASAETRLAQVLLLAAGYTWVDARVSLAPGYEALVGKRLAQDPEHRGFASFTFDAPQWLTATVQLRAASLQYEDDLNTLPIPGVLLVDVSASRRLAWGLELFAAVENIANRRYLVGRAGIDTYGSPLMARVGLRLRRGPSPSPRY